MNIQSLQTLKRALTKSVTNQFNFLMADLAKKVYPPGTEVRYKLDHMPGKVLTGKINAYMTNEPHLAMIQREGGTGDTVAVWLLEPVKPFFVETVTIEHALGQVRDVLTTEQMDNVKGVMGI